MLVVVGADVRFIFRVARVGLAAERAGEGGQGVAGGFRFGGWVGEAALFLVAFGKGWAG